MTLVREDKDSVFEEVGIEDGIILYGNVDSGLSNRIDTDAVVMIAHNRMIKNGGKPMVGENYDKFRNRIRKLACLLESG